MGVWYSASGVNDKTIKYHLREVVITGVNKQFIRAQNIENKIWACGTLPNKLIKYQFERGGRHGGK